MKETLAYFGYHKCATQWINAILRDVAARSNLIFINAHTYKMIENITMNGHTLLSDTGACAVKLHLMKHYRFKGFHVIRDPRDIIISAYFSHKSTHLPGPWLVEHRKKLNSVGFEEGLRLEIDFSSYGCHFDAMEAWNYSNPDIYETRFEIITINPFSEFKNIFQLMNLMPNPISEEILCDILQKYSFTNLANGREVGDEDTNSHFRKGVSGDWKNHFSENHKKYFKKKFGAMLIKLGYEKDLLW